LSSSTSDSIFPIPRGQTISADMDRLFKAVRSGRHPTEERWKVERRASSFPVCPRAFNICYRLPPSERPFKDESFASQVATEMGEAMHLVLQRWFGLEDEALWGNWKCPPCGKIRKHKFGPQYCKACGGEMLYEEYAIPRMRGIPFTGHIDALIKRPSGNYLVDFKGSGTDKIRELKKLGRPHDYHYYQTNAYANVVNMKPKHFGGFGPIDKIIIIYVDRGWANRLWHTIQVPVSKKVFRQCIGLIDEAVDSTERITTPNGICNSLEDKNARWCPVKDICFSKMIDAKLKDKVWPEVKSTGGDYSLLKKAFTTPRRRKRKVKRRHTNE